MRIRHQKPVHSNLPFLTCLYIHIHVSQIETSIVVHGLVFFFVVLILTIPPS